MTTTVTVITVVRNGSASILQTINSVRDQVFPFLEHIIIDGESTDGTQDVISSASHPKLQWISEPDQGIYDAMNKGINLARGEWIFFLGADDQFSDSSVLRDLFLQKQRSVYRLICGQSTYLGGKCCSAKLDWRTLVFNTAQHQAVFYHRSLFNNFQYRIDIPVIADYELNFLAYYRKLPILAVERNIAVCGNSGVSQTANHYVAQISAFRIRTRHINLLLNIGLLTVGFANVLVSYVKRGLGRSRYS